MVPYAKTGGLADVAGTLPGEIQALGHEVVVFLPRYKGVDMKKWDFRVVVERLEVPLGSEREACRIFHRTQESGVQVYLVDHPEFFNRDEIYGTPLGDYPDNDRRLTL